MAADNSIKKYLMFIPIGTVVFLFTPSAIAQPPGIPRSDEPGAQASRFQAEAEKARAKVERKEPKKPQIDIEPEKEAPAVEEGPIFTLKGVNVTGSSIFTPEDFKKIYEPYLGKEAAFADIKAITEKIKGEYKKRGHLTTVVYIPEQDIVDGKVEIRISEGKVGEIMVEGNRWYSSSLIRKYIHVKKNEPLNIFKLQRDLIRLNQNSDLEVKTVITQGREPGTTDVILKVTDKFPYHAGAAVDNQGTRLVGKYRNSFSFRSSNLTGFNDSAYFSTIMSSTSSGNFLTYSFPIDTYGTKAGFQFTQFDTKLGKEYKGYDITGNTQIYTPHISGEIYLSDAFQVNVDTGLEIKSIKKKIIGNTTADDQLRIPYFAFDIMKLDAFLGGGQTAFSPRVSFGTADFLGASSRGHPTSSRPATGGSFVKYEHTASRFQKLPYESYAVLRSQLQFASRTLPPSEQLQLGGAYSVRGYPEGDYLSDYGATFNIDWYFPCYVFPKEWKLPHADKPLRYQVEPVVFFDLGGGGLTKTNPGEIESKILMGLGGGVKIGFNRNLFLRLDWAKALGGDGPAQGNGASTFYITLQTDI
ncbi:MAG: ShlB/FhaC/HecB family hemolysin secretion/activation protein [Candidatus Omnitrophota bacterium]